MVAETVPKSRRDRSSLTSVAGPVCGPLGYDAILDRGCGEPGWAIDLCGSVAVFTILPGLTDQQMEERRRITDAGSRTLKAADFILSLLSLTGIFRRLGANRLGAAGVLSTASKGL
jgi:hypothetical protein